MSGKPRFVLDTNVLISALMLSRSKPRLAWNQARRTGVILASHDTLRELAQVLRRPKLAAYVSPSESTAFLTELARVVQLVPIRERVELCRDPRDDKFLELALAGRADFLLTGDADLLALHPFGELRLSARQRISTTPSAAWRRTRLRKNGCEAEASA